ncbi:MAG: IclR family transcriptional regulator [Boseongicola sp.]|nr:IclR family transcriptional regulator [Boseongicola sp.]
MLLMLEVISNAGKPLTATDIGREVGLAKQTSQRLCATLESEGFLIRHANSKKFVPARRARLMSSGLLHASRSHIARRQVLQDVAQKVQETVNFVVPEETGMSYLDRVETDWPFRVQFPIGSNVPFHCTASGKTFMASLPPKARKSFVNGLNLTRHTQHTHVTTESLLGDLAKVAKRGFALDEEEFIDGMIAIAVPVYDPQGQFAAALAFHGPTQRISIDTIVSRQDILREGAERLTDVLFGDV